LSIDLPSPDDLPCNYCFDPQDPVPSISGNVSAFYELLPFSEGMSAEGVSIWDRFRELLVSGASHQKEAPHIFGCKPPYLPISTRSDVLVFQTPSLEEDVEVTGPITVKLWASSSAVDTDFTAKLIDVHPPNEDYPHGYDMNLTDSIIRARYRNGWKKEELMTPGRIYELKFELYPTSNVFKAGHRIRVEISSSNFPRFDVNPNTGERLGQHTHTIVAHNIVYVDRDHPSHIMLPVIRSKHKKGKENDF
jgi:predicted acyl esterase